MRLLALEASTLLPSCALLLDGEVIERRCPVDRNSSETLLPEIMAMLADAGLGLRDLDGIAFGAGPGSFTGLRVAAGITQGLAFAADLRVAPVETLAAVALADGAEFVLAALDARMNEIYLATYRRNDGRLERIGPMQVGAPGSVALPDPASPWIVCGNAAEVYPAFASRLGTWTVSPSSVPLAGAIAVLGNQIFAAGESLPPDLAQPVYVRDKVAFTVAERLAQGGKA